MEAIAVVAGKAALSAAFNAICGILASQDLLKYVRRNNVESEVNWWGQFLKGLNKVLDDAEERQMSERPIKIWLDNLRDLTYDVEDILDEFSTEVLRQKVEAEDEVSSSEVRKLINIIFSCCSPRDINFNVCFGKKMEEITQRFGGITKEIEKLRLIERVTGGSSGVVRKIVETTCLVQESQVFGRKKDKETLINELLSRDSNVKPVPVVAIVGMGGLGKTTLAQLVYNDERVSKSFDIKAWVCVSDEFDVFKITVKIIEGFTKKPCNMKDLNSVQSELKDALHKKKFLLILDDVWNEDYMNWVALSQPLAEGGLGSRVLITTRNEKVAVIAGTRAVFMHRLKKLEVEECLSLLALHAFGVNTFSGHPSLREIGEQIAKKCDGLPLAATALGGLLRVTVEPREWSKVLNSNIWELPQDPCRILPALRVSYHYLPSHLKPCFGYCAIFPKDYEFEKDDLIMWWMAQGFLEQSKNVAFDFMEVGNEYFNDLLSRSFFQPSSSGGSIFVRNGGSRFVMHDLINDLANWISGGICLYLPHNVESNDNIEESNNNIEFEKLRHLSFMPHKFEVAKRFEKISSSMKLRSFIALNQCYYHEPHNLLSYSILDKVIVKMKCLKLLCLRGYEIYQLPHSISNLKQLQYLDVSFTSIGCLPESIGDLFNLQVLKLNNCKKLWQLPQNIRNLINLRFLDISKTRMWEMPSGICRLTNLQSLTKFIVGENQGLSLKELKELLLIRGKLSIWGLEKVVNIQDTRDANLKAKKDIVSLNFNWKFNFNWKEETSTPENEKQVQILIELQPHSNLKNLKISGYNGKRFPNWIGHFNLETLCLGNCNSVSLLPPLGGMSSLRELIIDGMHEVKNVKKEFLGNTSNSFLSLETLTLKRMNALKEWCSDPWSGEEARIEFPQLKELVIGDCPMLVGKLPNHFPLLEELSIFRCLMLAGLPNQLPSLGKLDISGCLMLAGLPNQLPSLGKLDISGCSMLASLPNLLPLLKELSIDQCSMLVSLPNQLPLLEELSIDKCPMLAGLPNELPLVGKLSINGCPNLKNLECRYPSLRELTIEDCSGSTLKILANLSSLVRLKLENIRELNYLDDGLGSMLGKLQELEIIKCKELKTLVRNGKGIEGMVGLKTLTITFCDELKALVAAGETRLSYLPSLEMLDILGCDKLVCFGPMWLPSSLKKMEIHGCNALKCLPEGFMMDGSNTCESALEELSIGGCRSLTTFPGGRFPDQLVFLSIGRCDNLESMPKFSNSIKKLSIIACDHIQSLPRFPASVKRLEIKNLESLDLESTANEKAMSISLDRENVQYQLPSQEKMFADCSSSLEDLVIEGLNWRKLPKNMTTFQMLKILTIQDCKSLRELPKQIQELTCVRELTIKKCPNLELLAGHGLPREVENLTLKGCEKLIKRLLKGGFSPLASLMHLEIDGVGDNIKQEAPVFLPNLRTLTMRNFGNLESLAVAFQLPSSIKELLITECPRLRELPIHELSSNFQSLQVFGCPLLKERCLDKKGEYWPKLSIMPNCYIEHQTLASRGQFG